jgi:alpha-tubulin suppressor-like RCC1 family protein
MKGARTAVLFVLLLLFSSLSLVVLSINKGDLNTALNNEESPMEVIVPLGQANVAGFQEGSIYTNTTLSSSLEMDSHTCAILDNGDLKCWGSDVKGQLGDGGSNTNTNAPSSTAIDLGTGRTAVAVSAGDRYTCAILDNGDLKCWGWDYYGQLGDGGTNTDTNAPSSTAIDLGTGRTAVAVSAGSYHTCVILDNGDLKCWGRDNHGQLGDGGSNTDTNTPSSTAIDLGTGRTAVAVDAGDYHTCAILDNGDMKCWGYDFKGQLGDGGSNTNTNAPSSTAIDLGTGRTAVAVSAGAYHTCAILDNSDLKCWGWDDYGQLGDGGTNTDTNAPSSTAIDLDTGRTAVAVSAGAYHTCAILDNGDLKCWGWDDYGQLGDGGTNTDTNAPSSTAIDLGTGRTAVAMSTGETHTCAILDNGKAKCWGRDLFGQLGDGGSNTATNAPSSTTIDLGTGRTMAVSERDLDGDGVLNIFDSTPYPPTTNPPNPLPQRNVAGFQEGSIYTNSTLASGMKHTCALLDDGTVSCWGDNTYSQLGDGTATERNTPAQTSSLGTGRTAVAISSGLYYSCAILDDASVSCWGYNYYGELGDGTTTQRNTPTQTSSLGTGRTAVAISSGYYHTCAILDDGSVSCWGYNYYGELGDGTTINRTVPTQTSSLGTGRTAVALSSGGYHTCAILDDGSVSCWGWNRDGQLGDGTTTDRNTPTQTSSLGTNRTAVAISSGGFHTCAILDDASVSCWGVNAYGILGDGTITDRTTPTQTSSLGTGRTAVAISSAGSYTCAILDDGSVSCWGSNYYGQLGDGTGGDYTNDYNRNTPTQTSSLGTGRTAVAISSGSIHTCAILDDASVSCWGSNSDGQLGDGTTTDRNTPTQTSSLGTIQNPRTAALSERDWDNDGILNIFDSTPYTVPDTDGDGIPDFTDDCPDSAGNSTIDLLGCPDSDGDGYSDSGDVFPSNPGEWDDADGDGTGDNGDVFPNDGNETSDSDGDGVGDNADVFPNDGNETSDSDGDGVGDNGDSFPNDGNETSDSDGDGVGDNADVFPDDSDESVDSDDDGVGDNADAFPENSNETADSDNDGLGDNEDDYPFINNFIDSDGDEIPDLFDDFINDPTQWSDYDGDGYGDYSEGNNSDAFINNATQWFDTDGDGYGDNWGNSTWNTTRLFIWPGLFVIGAELADHCPTEFGNSSADGYFGCLDVDGDGIADMYDDLIQNESQSNETNGLNETNETASIDSDADGVDDLYDLCPSTVADGYVDIDGCLFDQDGDGVDDLKDACPDSNPQVSVNVNGCAVESDEEKSFLDSFRSGDQEAVLQTVGIGAVLIALLGFLQTNLVAALLPDSVRWLRVFKGNSKLNKEEVQELEYLKSLVQTYYQDRELLEDELFQLKSELTARYTNSEIKKTTREKINTIVEDLLNMGDSELAKIAHNDSYFGLYGATGVGQRSDVLELDKLMNSSELTGRPDSLNQGEVNEIDGYEYLQYPAESDTWYIRNNNSGEWDEWSD